MRTPNPRAAGGFSGEQAAGYDARSRVAIPGYEVLHDLVAVLLRSELGLEARVLVAGAGTGEEIVRLAPGNPGWRFVGVDPAPDMLVIARRRIAESGAADRAEAIDGFVAELPPEPAFDAATLLLVMHFLPDDGAKLELLQSIAERLKPGAPLLLADLHGDPAASAFDRLLAAWKRRVVDAVGDRPEVSESFGKIREDIAFVPEARIFALLDEAGFDAPFRFWGGLLFGGWIARRQRDGQGDRVS